MSKILIHAEDFLYIARFSSTDPTRPYLAGVRVETYSGYALLIATDGHRAGILRVLPDDATGEFVNEGEPVTIPNDKELLAACKGKNRMLRIDMVESTITVFTAGDLGARVGVTFHMRDMGTFPDWRRIVPSGEPSGETGSYAFSAKYIKDFAPGGKDQAVQVNADGTNPALVTTSDERFIGILMPIRHGQGDPVVRKIEVLAT